MAPDPDLDLPARVERASLDGSVFVAHDAHPPARHLPHLHHPHLAHPTSSSTSNLTSSSHPPAAGDIVLPASTTNAQALAHHAAATLDPDDYYRSYQTAPSPGGEPQSLPMASPVPPPTADGAAARHLQPPANRSAGRQGTSTAVRSASSPLDRRAAAASSSSRSPSASAPSVRDLKKRFDQNGGPNSIPRAPPRQAAPVARVSKQQDSGKPKPRPKPGQSGPSSTHPSPRSTAPASNSSRQSRSSSSNSASTSHSTSKLTSTSTPASSARSQKPRHGEREQAAASSRSFANRIGNHHQPETSTNGNSTASSSMTPRPPNSPPSASQPSPPSPKSNPQFPGLLFGEIPPGQHDGVAPGFGIDNIRPRRTSESNVHGLVGRQRSVSDLEAEPASPSSWYRDLHMSRGSAPKTHARSRSDLSTLKPILTTLKPKSPTPASTSASASAKTRAKSPTVAGLAAATVTATAVAAGTAAATPSASHASAAASSKLPVSISRRLASPSNSSPTSSRSNSPSTLRRPPVNGRSSSRQTKPVASTTRAKTPTQTGRKQPPQGLVTPSNSNNRLQAYVSTAPPKLSPPLRSSRPRQPVSVATTASSRMKEAAKAKAPARPNARDGPSASKTYDPAKRKIIVGPIDFEQRREHIRLAYTKTIRESQAFEVRQKAVERRRKQMEEAQTKATATEATDTNNTAAAPSTSTDSPTTVIAGDDEATNKGSPDGHARVIPEVIAAETGLVESPSAREPAVELPADHGSRAAVENQETLLETPTNAASHPAPGKDDDSPTLGIPGGFPGTSPSSTVARTQRPLSTISIISATSAVTEFDTEPQAELADLAMSDRPLSPQIIVPTRERSQYRSPFEDDDFASSPPRPRPATHQISQDRRHIDQPFIPDAYYDNEHREDSFEPHAQQNYQTIVTILPQPSREPPAAEETAQAASFPRLDIQDESDCHSDLESVPAMARRMRSDVDDAATDACTEETDDRDGMEDERSPYRYGGPLSSSNRASTCASSDIETFDDLLYPSHDEQLDAGPPNRLLAPPSISRADRSSHQTAWTNVSVDSITRSEASDSPGLRASSWKMSGSSGRDDSSLRSLPYSGVGVRPSVDSTRSSIQLGQQLPELDTGEGFSIPYLSAEATSDFSYLSSPQHEPPPHPRSGRNSAIDSQTSSLFFEQSQYGSTLVNSERGSGEYVSHHSETPLSMMDMTSMETMDRYFDGRAQVDSDAKSFIQESEGLSTEERHRLIQRRNVIKELVDTEAIFVRDMNIVEEIYKGTAEACPKLDAKIVKLIFRNSDEIIEFHTSFLVLLKEAVASVYVPKGGRSLVAREDSIYSEQSQSSVVDLSDAKDRETSLGPTFQANMEKMKLAHEGFLRNSDQAAKKLIQIQQDPTVQIWLNECNEVAKDLTAAWDLDSLLIKPMQRITKYPNLIMTLLQHTPQDHPDREALVVAKDALEEAIIEINKTKKNFELVGQIVGRKRKESDVKAGLARAFGKKVDKLQAGGTRPPEDPEYLKLEERFSDDYLRLQVVLRDVEFYTRQVSSYVHEFLQYLSAIELVMRLQPGSFPELESKWVRFNISIRDIEKVALEQHLSQIRKLVIEPFEQVIKSYGNPSLAMKKRQKRRVVWERAEQLKKAGKSVDPKLKELVEQYEALNDTLTKELPKLSALTEKVGNICLGNLINIQANWYFIWREKMRAVLPDSPTMPDMDEIVATFQRDFPYANEMMASISIINPAYRGRTSQSTTHGDDASLSRTRGRTSESTDRAWSQSFNGEAAPSLPPPDFGKRHSGSFTLSPISAGPSAFGTSAPSPHQYYYRDFYAGLSSNQAGMTSPRSAEVPATSRSLGGTRPSTGKSYDSSAISMPRQSTESAPHIRRDSGTAYYSSYHQHDSRRFSNLFHSALPLPDGPEESQRSSRASSRERGHASDGYNILWLAASLFEFNISTTKHEAGYPYLTYQAGEIFDVIAEKGELWLAKNQDDPTDQVGWIWSKHFAKLADS